MGSDMIMEEFRQLCKVAWEKQHWLVIIDLSRKKHTTVNLEVGLTSFTYQIKLKTKQIVFPHYQMKNFLNKMQIIQKKTDHFQLQ